MGVYSDSGCTVALSSVSWGTLRFRRYGDIDDLREKPGQRGSDAKHERRQLDPSSASSYLTLTWDRDGYSLAAGASVQAVLSLAVSSSISGITTFSFNMNIAGTQSP